MNHTFRELTLGGVLVAPFVAYAAVAFVVMLVLRPLLRFIAFEKLFSHPSIAELGLYVTVLGMLTVLF